MKKILAMLLTGVMIIGTLSGCGDGTTEVATAGDSNVSACLLYTSPSPRDS